MILYFNISLYSEILRWVAQLWLISALYKPIFPIIIIGFITDKYSFGVQNTLKYYIIHDF